MARRRRRLQTVEFDEYGYMSELLLNIIATGVVAMIAFWCWIIFEVLRARGEDEP